ncbi:hypothetical protein LEMLEM_LOCUS16755, partial [Lemmus lemmus]
GVERRGDACDFWGGRCWVGFEHRLKHRFGVSQCRRYSLQKQKSPL